MILSASSGDGRCILLIPWRAHPNVALFVGVQDDRHGALAWIGFSAALAKRLLSSNVRELGTAPNNCDDHRNYRANACRAARPKFDAWSPAKISDVTGSGLYLFVTP